MSRPVICERRCARLGSVFLAIPDVLFTELTSVFLRITCTVFERKCQVTVVRLLQ